MVPLFAQIHGQRSESSGTGSSECTVADDWPSRHLGLRDFFHPKVCCPAEAAAG